jgi:hypothetical protein
LLSTCEERSTKKQMLPRLVRKNLRRSLRNTPQQKERQTSTKPQKLLRHERSANQKPMRQGRTQNRKNYGSRRSQGPTPRAPGLRESRRKAECAPSQPPRAGRYLRHPLRDQVTQWAQIGANGQVLSWIKHGVAIQWKQKPPPPFNLGVSMRDATPSQLAFMETELERLIGIGAWEEGRRSTWVSPMFLVPKGDK